MCSVSPKLSISRTRESEVGADSIVSLVGQKAVRRTGEVITNAGLTPVGAATAIARGFTPARSEATTAAERGAESTVSEVGTVSAEGDGGLEPIAGGSPPSPLDSNGKSCGIGGSEMRAAPSVIS